MRVYNYSFRSIMHHRTLKRNETPEHHIFGSIYQKKKRKENAAVHVVRSIP